MAPTITVLTPSLNAAATIEETLESVWSQGYEPLEQIVIDGGSTDDTIEIARRRPGVKVLEGPDRGLSDAMNKGVAGAAGEVIGWLNADDRFEPGALHRVADAFSRDPAPEWVTGRCRIVDSEGREIRRAVTAYKNALLRSYTFSLYLVQNFISSPATFVRADVLRACGPFDERFKYSMDYDMWLRLAARSRPVILDEYLASFRMAGGSLSMEGFERQFAEHALNATEHGQGHPLAAAANRAVSRCIVAVYRLLRLMRRE